MVSCSGSNQNTISSGKFHEKIIDRYSCSIDHDVSTVRAFETDVWQKIDAEWKVVSLHYSEIPPDE